MPDAGGWMRFGRVMLLATAVLVGDMLAGTMVAGGTAAAAGRHRPHVQMHEAEAPARPVIPYGYSFYPHEIEGGVSGNLSFNNQIRKFKDPLNANGGGG